MLYSDTRAELEASAGGRRCWARSGAGDRQPAYGGASILPKLLWLKRHRPERLAGRPRLHVGAKDVLIERLCGAHVTDHTTAATTGLYDLDGSRWLAAWLPRLHLDVQLPELRWPTPWPDGSRRRPRRSWACRRACRC